MSTTTKSTASKPVPSSTKAAPSKKVVVKKPRVPKSIKVSFYGTPTWEDHERKSHTFNITQAAGERLGTEIRALIDQNVEQYRLTDEELEAFRDPLYKRENGQWTLTAKMLMEDDRVKGMFEKGKTYLINGKVIFYRVEKDEGGFAFGTWLGITKYEYHADRPAIGEVYQGAADSGEMVDADEDFADVPSQSRKRKAEPAVKAAKKGKQVKADPKQTKLKSKKSKKDVDPEYDPESTQEDEPSVTVEDGEDSE